jgi:hypothetical protein
MAYIKKFTYEGWLSIYGSTLTDRHVDVIVQGLEDPKCTTIQRLELLNNYTWRKSAHNITSQHFTRIMNALQYNNSVKELKFFHGEGYTTLRKDVQRRLKHKVKKITLLQVPQGSFARQYLKTFKGLDVLEINNLYDSADDIFNYLNDTTSLKKLILENSVHFSDYKDKFVTFIKETKLEQLNRLTSYENVVAILKAYEEKPNFIIDFLNLGERNPNLDVQDAAILSWIRAGKKKKIRQFHRTEARVVQL